MTTLLARNSCAHCNKPLPRAAFSRCPFCFVSIGRPGVSPNMICRRCNTHIPHAHAGQCPSCLISHRATYSTSASGGHRQ